MRASLAGVLIGFAALGTVPSAAQDSDCARYALRGIAPGMTAREVWKALGGKGDETRIVQGEGGPAGLITYRGWPAPVTAQFDREGTRSDARVVEVRMVLPARPDRPSRELLQVVGRMGAPAWGAPNLETAFAGGPSVWADRGCNILVRATREDGGWWEGSTGATVVEVRPLDASCRAMDPPGLPWEEWCAPPEPDRAGAPSVEVEPPLANPLPAFEDLPLAPPREAGGVLVPPTRLPGSYVAPRYPELMRRNGVRARVELELTVEPDGRVSGVRVLSAEPRGRGFEEAAVSAARQWRYTPGTREGVPVRASVPVTIGFE